MEFFKMKKLRKAHKPNPEKPLDERPIPEPQLDCGKGGESNKSVSVENATEAEDDDDDFIMDEVKRRLKELRRNSFMVLIPEESGPVEEEEEEECEMSSSQWRDVEAEGRQLWSGFDAFYEKYCERMHFFDQLSAQQLNGAGSHNPSTPPPRSTSTKLSFPLRCLSLKKIEEPEDDTECLHQLENDVCQDLEVAYVAHLCLTWEALHCQYTQLSQKIACQPESSTCYNHSAQQFQQFEVLLQRFIEDEPFENGLRCEVFARARISWPKLLQVPIIKGSDQKQNMEEESNLLVLAPDLIRVVQSSILTFQLFLKMDKKKQGGVRYLFGAQNQLATPLQQIQSSLQKRKMKLKELQKKRKGGRKKCWPATEEEVDLLLGLIDVEVLSRVVRMGKISKEQLFWSEEKLRKLDFSTGKLQRDPSPILFPC